MTCGGPVRRSVLPARPRAVGAEVTGAARARATDSRAGGGGEGGAAIARRTPRRSRPRRRPRAPQRPRPPRRRGREHRPPAAHALGGSIRSATLRLKSQTVWKYCTQTNRKSRAKRHRPTNPKRAW